MKNRIADIINASGKTQRSIAKAIGVHENTFNRYYSGERPMTLPLAHKMMGFLGMNPALLFDDSPVRPALTGLGLIDAMLVKLINSVMSEDCIRGIDTAAHYFSDTFLCASPEYTYGGGSTERIGDSGHMASEVPDYDWSQVRIDKNIQFRGVTRAQEFSAFKMRRKSGHIASFDYEFAHLVDDHTICFLLQSNWAIIDDRRAPANADQWKIRESYQSVDHLILRHSVSQVLYEGANLLIDRKIWHPIKGHFTNFAPRR